MGFLAILKGNGADPANLAPALEIPDAEPSKPNLNLADSMLRKMFGFGISDLQSMSDEAGKMLAGYEKRLDNIDKQLAEIIELLQSRAGK
jgi:hypothetical protein